MPQSKYSVSLKIVFKHQNRIWMFQKSPRKQKLRIMLQNTVPRRAYHLAKTWQPPTLIQTLHQWHLWHLDWKQARMDFFCQRHQQFWNSKMGHRWSFSFQVYQLSWHDFVHPIQQNCLQNLPRWTYTSTSLLLLNIHLTASEASSSAFFRGITNKILVWKILSISLASSSSSSCCCC